MSLDLLVKRCPVAASAPGRRESAKFWNSDEVKLAWLRTFSARGPAQKSDDLDDVRNIVELKRTRADLLVGGVVLDFLGS